MSKDLLCLGLFSSNGLLSGSLLSRGLLGSSLLGSGLLGGGGALLCSRLLGLLVGYDGLLANELESALNLEILANTVSGNDLLDLLDGDVVLVGNSLDLGLNVLVGNRDVLKSGDLLKSQTHLDLTYGLGTGLLAHLVKIKSGVAEVELKAHTLLTESHIVIANDVLDLTVKHLLGDLGNKLIDKSVAQLIVDLVLGNLIVSLLDFCLKIGLVFIKSIKLRNILGKLIVKSGKLDGVDAVQLDLEDNCLTCKLCGVVLLGEGDVDVELLADGVTDYLILKAGNELTRAELQGRAIRALPS